jgi:hypothetical protein
MNNLCKNILFGKAGSLQTRIDGSITPDFAYILVTAFLEADNKDLALRYYYGLDRVEVTHLFSLSRKSSISRLSEHYPYKP